MKKQRILSALLTLCLVFSLVPTALAAGADGFTDVGKDSWCYDYVDYVTSEGYFLGTTDTTFSPDRNMTRAMFVVVLSRFDGVNVNNGQSSFADVEAGSWCAGAVEWAAENGIVTGYADGTFKPNASITRAQMCAIMDRYVDYYTEKHNVVVAQKGKAGTLTDQYQVPAYADTAVRNCQKYGLINGYSDGTFRPQANSTRAHVAAIIYRLAFLIDGAKDASVYMVCPECGALMRIGGKCPDCGYNASTDHFNGNGGREQDTSTPEIDPNDLIGLAVKDSMDQANDRYDAAKKAVKDAVNTVNAENKYFTKEELSKIEKTINNMLDIGDVTFSSKTDGDSRPQTITASVKATDNLAATIITKATALALELVDEKPTMDDIDGLIQAVKDAVAEETGVVISDKSYEEIKAQVIDLVMTEGKSLWTNFQDQKGGYYCGNVTVTAGDEIVGVYTATIKVDADKHTTTLVGTSKTDAVKNVAEKVAKQMFQDLKEASAKSKNDYVSKATVSGTVTLTFEDAETYAAKTAKFPHEYPVTLQLKLDSDGLVQYKYAGGENYLKLYVNDTVKDAYIDSVDQVAKTLISTDTEVQAELKALIVKELKANVDDIYGALQEKLGEYDLGDKLPAAMKEDIENALTQDKVVDSWLDTNMDSLYASLDSGEIKNLDNTVLINAVWGVLEEQEVLPQNRSDMRDWVETMVKSQTEGFNLIAEINKNSQVQMLANYNVVIEDIEDVQELVEFETELLGVKIVGRDIIYDQAKGYLDGRFAESQYKDLYDQLDDTTKSYLIYTALVEFELDYTKEQKKVANQALDELLDIIATPDVFKASIDEKINAKLEKISVAEILNKENDEETQKYAELVKLLNELKSSAVKEKTFTELAEVLTNETLQEKIGTHGDTVVQRYLARIINWIPSGASITFKLEGDHDVTLNKEKLNLAFEDADSTADVMDDLAMILGKFEDLTIADLEEPGIPVEVTYNSRSFEFQLVVSDQ